MNKAFAADASEERIYADVDLGKSQRRSGRIHKTSNDAGETDLRGEAVVSALGVWSDEDIAYHAETCTELERKIICLCAERKTIGYRRLAERTSVTYAEAQRVGQLLRAANLANIQLLGHGYAGSGIFLNDNGQKLRLEILRRFP